MNDTNPTKDGYYLVYLPAAQFAAAQEALRTKGITLSPMHYTELGNESETHCTLTTANGMIRELLDDRLADAGLRIRPDLSQDQLREIAEHYTNDREWTTEYEVAPDRFRNKFPEFLEPRTGS